MNDYISRTCLWKNPGGLKFWVKYYYPGRAPAPDGVNSFSRLGGKSVK
ncbi:MAG TPA: hypothetical protein VGR06_27840 [Actinophytocola sp.]|jgi:hypothetical protein|nr:hypothetical protein [Actinophytocola sp.]